jgi:hypothetical protein
VNRSFGSTEPNPDGGSEENRSGMQPMMRKDEEAAKEAGGRFVPRFTLMSRYFRSTDDSPRTMGDKSPKATNKQASQKQAKNNANTQKKNSAAAAKQTVVKGKK